MNLKDLVEGCTYPDKKAGGTAEAITSPWQRFRERCFPVCTLTWPDYILGGVLLLVVYISFYHADIVNTGWDSLHFLFGNPLDFYENCRKSRPTGLFYLPTTYAVFALWFSPLKLLGIVKDAGNFSIGLTLWAKALTTLLYLISGLVFYRVTQFYARDRAWGKYATALWLTMPLAMFSQFIFASYDIFHVLLALIGFYLFLKGRTSAAAACFGTAITFKYFPTFAFIPLLLLFEKNFIKILSALAIFIAPTVAVHALYHASPVFIETVVNYAVVDRVYADIMNLGSGWQIYWLFAAFAVFCASAYMSDISKERLPFAAAYVYLAGSVFPFLFIVWHPQWMMCFGPALTLTTVLGKKSDRFLLLDLVGMFFFVGIIADLYVNNVDAVLFRGTVFGIDFQNSYKMSNLFSQFQEHSPFVFLSCFWGYLVAQLIWKFRLIASSGVVQTVARIDYNTVRYRFWGGLFIFLLPAAFVIYKDVGGPTRVTLNVTGGSNYGELTKGRTFEQSFPAREPYIDEVDLLLATFARHDTGTFTVSIVDSSNRVLGSVTEHAETVKDNSWKSVKFDHLRVIEGAQYRIRLAFSTGRPGDAITWWSSGTDTYWYGNASVDGIPKPDDDFAFKVIFSK